jgi:hypothetical protein
MSDCDDPLVFVSFALGHGVCRVLRGVTAADWICFEPMELEAAVRSAWRIEVHSCGVWSAGTGILLYAGIWDRLRRPGGLLSCLNFAQCGAGTISSMVFYITCRVSTRLQRDMPLYFIRAPVYIRYLQL